MVKYYTRYGIDTKHDDGTISTSDYNRDEPLHLFYLIIGLEIYPLGRCQQDRLLWP